MEEREALKRQIELLQGLIDKHKSVHGDTPFSRVEQRQPEGPASVRGRSTSLIHPHSSRGRLYAPQSNASWRKTYSLRNKNPPPSVGLSSASTSASAHSSGGHSLSHSASLPSHSRVERSDGVRTASLSSGIHQQKREGHSDIITGIKVATEKKHTDALKKTGAALSPHKDGKGGSSSTSLQSEKPLGQTQEVKQKPESRHVVLPGESKVPSPVKASTVTSLQSVQVQIKPPLTSKTSTDTKQSINMTIAAALSTGKTTPPPSALFKAPKQPSMKPTSHSSQGQVGASFVKRSKFTWVKSQNVGGLETKQASIISSPTGKSVSASPTSLSKTGSAGGSSPVFGTSKRTPAKKLSRKLSPVTAARKTSKYKWVSSSAGAQAKISRKSCSPKSQTLSLRAQEKGEASKKARTASVPSAKIKTTGSSTSLAQSSRFRWKAGGQSTSAAVTGGTAGARRRSAFHWTSEKINRGVRGGPGGAPSLTQRTSPVSLSSPGAFKLRSRMKIIRRSASSGSESEKGSSYSAAKVSPRVRIQRSVRSPVAGRRAPCRDLVPFGRHKLRRLSHTASGAGPASSSHRGPASTTPHRGAASQRVYRTRYKMVTRLCPSTTHPHHYNPNLSWRTKRIQTARSFLQSRMRAPHDRHPSSTQHWRGSSMCWIRGSLYRVSANKLSRTTASNRSINQTGRSLSSTHVWSINHSVSQPSSTRHLASRAVQRSLAIIRHARQKKQQKQYCMYYNRFGKCNRGNSCPYIHDPDKVAVCTRFLRGTCKQADGTCPFSHKVAKEKMPVCSYFLKGICNNSDCPYSHVYVSRKAEVCEDFVKGYCPAGEKCKKKHTLVCPDFSKTGSCPRGARCKLQHRQRAKRSTSSTSSAPAKKTRTKEPSKRPSLSVIIPEGSPAALGTPAKRPFELPSFISLSSSPEEADAPETQQAETSQVKEKKLQIKPRL